MLVAHWAAMLRILLLTSAALLAACSLHAQPHASHTTRKFVGSAACKSCHQAAYNGWRQTRMANVVRDPKVHPDAVLGDFAHPDPRISISTWKDSIKVYATKGAKAFEEWLNTQVFENIENVNKTLQKAHSWHEKVDQHATLHEPVHA